MAKVLDNMGNKIVAAFKEELLEEKTSLIVLFQMAKLPFGKVYEKTSLLHWPKTFRQNVLMLMMVLIIHNNVDWDDDGNDKTDGVYETN